jgi:four helix bundle protein
MENKKSYIHLKDLEIYKLERELSKTGWEIYETLDWQTKKVMGDQFITAIDSFGADIAEGYSRYHYLDKIKFFHIARASLVEAADHWLPLLEERRKSKRSFFPEIYENCSASIVKIVEFYCLNI